MNVARMGLLVGLVSLIGLGCQNKIAQENRALWEQNRELQARLATSETAPGADAAQVASLQQQLAERDAKLAELQNQLRQPTAGQSEPQIANIETSYDKESGKMTVAVPGDVLFSAGAATIRDDAKGTLDKVARSMKNDYAGKKIQINGHTDADPIKYSKWKNNQELSLARANAVKQYLVQKGIPANSISTQGFGSDQPKAKDKSMNRRVDIVVAMR